MIIEIITTGDEVLTGFTVDTNAAWLCQQLLDQGWQVRRRQTVGDRLDDLVQILSERSLMADILIVNGGLGPTADDKTTEAAAIAANEPLVLRQEWLQLLQQRYAQRGRAMPESNRKQACLPQGASIIPNPIGTACGFRLRIGKADCYFTPGVPSEFKRMVTEQIIPALAKQIGQGDSRVERYFTFGISESSLSDRLDTLSWPPHLELGYRSSMPLIELKLISQQAGQTDFAQAEQQLLSVIGPFLVGRGDYEPSAHLAALLGGRPVQLLEWGTRGQLLAELAAAIDQLHGNLAPLPADPQALLQHISIHSQLTLAIGDSGPDGFSVALWDGKQGWAQSLSSHLPEEALRRRVVSFAAQQMLCRYLAGQPVLAEYETLRGQKRSQVG